MKRSQKLIAGLLLGIGCACWAQSMLRPRLLYSMVNGVPTPVSSTSTTGVITGFIPEPFLAKCMNGSTIVDCVFGSGAASSGVSSFNNRTGAVTPQSGDYTASLVGAAPATNPTGGQANYASIANPVFTGSATSPSFVLSDVNGNPITVSLTTPQSGFTREIHQSSSSNAFHVAVFGGGYSGLEYGTDQNNRGEILYNGGHSIWAVDGFNFMSAAANQPTSFYTPASAPSFIDGVESPTFSATPAFSASIGMSSITLTGNVTSSTIGAPSAGSHKTIFVCQDSTGGRTFTWPTSVKGVSGISSGTGQVASTCSVFKLSAFNTSTWYLESSALNE